MPYLRQMLVATILSVLLLTPAANAADRNCTAAEKEQADQALWLNKRDRDAAIKRHLPYGLPSASSPTENEQILVQRDYVIGYDGDLRGPLWTAHKLKIAAGTKSDRINCFRRDIRIEAPLAASTTDFSEPLFDQGHLSPNADFTGSGDIAVINSFVMSNMAPQYCQFNRGVWQILEEMTRRWSESLGIVYVVSGSIYDRDNNESRDADEDAWRMRSTNGQRRVAIPSHFYKVIVHPLGSGAAETIAFLLPHDRTDVEGEKAATYLSSHVVPIATIEKVAGVKLFPDRTKAFSETKAGEIWDYGSKVPGTLVRAPCRQGSQAMR